MRKPLSRLGVAFVACALSASLMPGGAAAAPKKPKFQKASTGAYISGYKWLGKRMFDFSIKSPSLKGKTYKARVLLPKGWSRKSKKTWPVVYALHGGRDTYLSWTRSTDIEGHAAKYDVMVVMPDGANGSYTDWYNYGKGGTPKWETFHMKEVIPLMEKNFRASTTKRAVMGNSSGGQGAFTYAARHPRKFKYAASFSGLLHITAPSIPTFLREVNAGNGQDPDAIWGRYPADAQNWKLHNPYDLAEGLRGTKLFFSSGTSGQPGPGDPQVDPWDIGLIAERWTGYSDSLFRDKLKRAKIPYTAHLYGDGRHNWPAWVRELGYAWPGMMSAIGARKY